MSDAETKRVFTLAIAGDEVLEFMRQIHHIAFTRGCNAGYRDAMRAVSEKIAGLEEELASKSRNDPYVMGEISALSQFAATLKKGAEDSAGVAGTLFETLGQWCKENDLSPLLVIFSQAIRKRDEAAK